MQLFMDHDGAIDDILSQMLVLTMPKVNLIGLSVTPADCYIEPGLASAYKVLQLFDRTDIPLGRGDYHGVNSFPNEWRARPEVINFLPELINLPEPPDPYTHPEAKDLMIAEIRASSEPVTVLMTGPCSNLVRALEAAPELKDKIAEVVWMGGAVEAAGNVAMYQHNGSAEWNVYWDPLSAKKLFASGLPITIAPLDVTNNVPVNRAFLSRLARQKDHLLSNLAGQLWAVTIDTIPSYHYVYFMWDILVTSYIGRPNMFKSEIIKLDVDTRPPAEGNTFRSENGQPIKVLKEVELEAFYDYILQQFKR